MFSSKPVVNLYSPDSPKSKTSNEYEITIGDLHSNTLLFLFFLRKHQIFLISDDDYAFIVKAYIDLESAQKRKLPREEVIPNIEKIIQIISECTVSKKPRLRLIGDEMADRGVSDLFILMILKKLHRHQVPYQILLSNHGLCFLSLFFGWVNHPEPKNWILNPEFSFKGLKYAVDMGVYSLDVMKAHVQNVYLPFLEVIDYSLCPIEQRITIYSHAAIGLADVASLAVYCNVEMRSRTIRELASTIENIKYEFKQKKFEQLCQLLGEVTQQTDERGAFELLKHVINSVLWKICWNRDYSPQCLQRIKYINDYQLRYVHGHDHEYSKDAHCISLDGSLGKSLEDNAGELKELKTKDVPLSKYIEYSFFYKLLMRYVYQPESYRKYFPYVALGLAIFFIKKCNQHDLSKVFSLFSGPAKLIRDLSEQVFAVYKPM